ncbi:P-type phospholipid transporter, variant 2 [Balamuthia mandrillaris]
MKLPFAWRRISTLPERERVIQANEPPPVRKKRKREGPSFATNYVSTAKYTVFTFLFKNLWEQFKRVANLYFLCIAGLQVIPGLSPTGRFTTLVPLLVVLTITALKEIFEDLKRHRQDHETNNRKVTALRQGVEQRIRWRDVKVGDILCVYEGEFFPADLLLLSSSDPQGTCYIETSSLDGENNLKVRQALPVTATLADASSLFSFRGIVKCEPPNKEIYSFTGYLNYSADDGRAGPSNEAFPLTSSQILLRGAKLCNTQKAFGLVLYTGADTKVVQNSIQLQGKRSRVERLTNRMVLVIFAFQILLCIGGALGSGFLTEDLAKHWYLQEQKSDAAENGLLGFLTFVILLNNLIPISLYVSMEAVKFGQAYFINNDLAMYHEASDTPARARTSNLNEELGQIDYIFTDKTGTLTCNQMRFQRCCIGGKTFGNLSEAGEDYRQHQQRQEYENNNFALEEEEDTSSSSLSSSFSSSSFSPSSSVSFPSSPITLDYLGNGVEEEEEEGEDETTSLLGSSFTNYSSHRRRGPKIRENNNYHNNNSNKRNSSRSDDFRLEVLHSKKDETSSSFQDTEILQHLSQNNPLVVEFFTALSVCHTVIPEFPDPMSNEVKYQASSPDEGALVAAARQVGFFFHYRSPTSIVVNIMGKECEFEVLNILEFNSDRKRMSVICRDANGTIKLYCKGADDVIFQRLSPHQQEQYSLFSFTTAKDDRIRDTKQKLEDYRRATMQHLREFGSQGLRTLCVAAATLDEETYQRWHEQHYVPATLCLVDREEEIANAAELIEKDMVLLGATGIEDRLQDNVPRTLTRLKKAGIKIWMLTGDKQETAINIGYACNLIKDSAIPVNAHSISSPSPSFMEDSEDEDSRSSSAANGYLFTLNETTPAATHSSLTSYLAFLEGVTGPTVGTKKPTLVLSTACLVVDGATLTHVFSSDNQQLQTLFLRLATQCETVICCRVSPIQKADVVNLMKQHTKALSLAIGDGANDISMLQAADVGIGISGEEGQQAARSSDYSIAQFSYLERLLLIHGRFSYQRISKVILYSVYKNIVLYITQFWFNALNGFSGQSLYERWTLAMYNILFTFVPVLIIGLFDKDVHERMALQFPQLYSEGRRNIHFNIKVFLGWLINSIYHSLLIFIITVVMYWENGGAMTWVGQSQGLYSMGVLMYTAVVLVVTGKLALETRSWTWLHHTALWGSLLVYFVFLVVWHSIDALHFASLGDDVYFVIYRLLEQPMFYLATFLIVVVALLRDFTWKYISRAMLPRGSHIVQEVQHKIIGKKLRKKRSRCILSCCSLKPSLLFFQFFSLTRATDTGYSFAQERGQALFLQST